ncbi:hypothetical protein [Nocardioides ungokensis]
MSAITQSIASGAQMLMGELLKNLDDSATVPLADPTYRGVYFGFLGLAAPLIGVVLLIAVAVACVRRDGATLSRAAVGVGVAGLGGAFYIVFAQLLVAVDNWLSHGVVRVTGYDFARSIQGLGAGFNAVAGNAGQFAANMLLILLMMTMLVAALILWFVMIFRKIAILVVVAFAPLLIAGYLWTPTRRWVVRLTEVLIALVFTKTAIYTLFGVGLALLSRGSGQSLSDFVASTVLMCGACFAPVVMLRLVHFAADTHLAGDALNTLRGGTAPVTGRAAGAVAGMGRHDHARSQGQARSSSTGPTAQGAPAIQSALSPSASGTSGAVGSTGAASAAGPAMATVAAAQATTGAVRSGADQAANTADGLSTGARGPSLDTAADADSTSTRRGPEAQTQNINSDGETP